MPTNLQNNLINFLNKSSKKQKKPVSKEQIATLLHFSYCNARDLFDEATLLRENKKYARAFTLCVLALEELAKMPIALNALFFKSDDKIAWDGFWNTFNSHSYKQNAAKEYGKYSPMKIADPKRWEAFYKKQIPSELPLNELKLASIYVDCYDGTALRPNKVFTDDKGILPIIFDVVKNRLEAWDQFHSTPKLSAEFVEAAIKFNDDLLEDGCSDFVTEEFRKRSHKKGK